MYIAGISTTAIVSPGLALYLLSVIYPYCFYGKWQTRLSSIFLCLSLRDCWSAGLYAHFLSLRQLVAMKENVVEGIHS